MKRFFGWLIRKVKEIINAHPRSVKYMFLAVIVWNYLEIVVHPHSEASCTFLKNMGLIQIYNTIINYGLSSVWMFFHSLYHCILDNSLLNAAGFFALFALVIAMLQTVYPYCLGEIFGYPIVELDLPDLDEQEIEKLVFYAAAVIFFEVFGWYLAEFAAMILGYWVIAESLYKILKWYKGQEKRKENVENKLEEDLKKILEKEEEFPGKAEEKTNEELQELLERIVKHDGVEERRIIKEFSECLREYGRTEYAKKESCIFWYSFYMADLLMDECRDKEHISGSWHFRFMKNQILSEQSETISEAYVMGILVGCLAKNVSGASQSVVGVILPKLQEKLEQEKFLGIVWMLCVFLECVCYADKRAFDTAVLMVNSGLISFGCLKKRERKQIQEKMAAFYRRLVELEIVERITEYDLPEKLKEELTGMQNRVPDTILGSLRVFTGGR